MTTKYMHHERVKLSDGQLEIILSKLGVEYQTEDDTHFMVFCPFHTNVHSAACSMAKDTGYFLCFNASCGQRGELIDFIRELKGWDVFRSMRFIISNKGEQKSYEKIMKEIQASSNEMPEFDKTTLDNMREAFLSNDKPREYMHSRGLEDRTLDKYHVGYDPRRDMVVVPMFDTHSRCVGVIGRTCTIGGEKRFKNSVNLPTKKTLFGINIAKKMNSDNVVICESSYDAMRVWQAGYASVATLGGTFSDYHKTQLARHFDGVILMVDNDDAGQKFAMKIAKGCRDRKMVVYQARFTPFELFPNGCKDASDCTDNQIRTMVKNKELFFTEQ